MADYKTNLPVIILVLIILAGTFMLGNGNLYAVNGGQSLERSVPSSVNPGQTFTVTYTTQNVPNSKYFVAWEDSISGGCSPSSYKQFIASESGGVEQITKTFTAPQSGSCTFSGYYQYADATQFPFSSKTVSICEQTTCSDLGYTCGTWDNGCGVQINCGNPTSNQICDNGQLLTCMGSADVDCNSLVTLQELITFANKWINNQIQFQDLIIAGQAWVNS